MQRHAHIPDTVKYQGQVPAPGISIFRHIPQIWLAVIGLIALLLTSFQFVSAQKSSQLVVQPPETDGFPTLSVAFKLPSGSGQPITDLQLGQLTVIENQAAIRPTSLTSEYRGVYFGLAINGDRELDLRDSAGVSRYEKLLDALKTSALNRTMTGADAWALVTNGDITLRSSAESQQWISALEADPPDFRQLTGDLSSIEGALRLLEDRVTPFGVDKVLLYLTPPPSPDQIAQIVVLTAKAQAAGIRVDVWMVGPATFLENDQGKALIKLATATGGQFFNFTGTETLPNPLTALEGLGYVHHLTYRSRLTETGVYPLEIRVNLDGLDIRGESQPFYLEVLPPKPILLSPPPVVTINRADLSEGEPENDVTVTLGILIEFPDHHPRAITESRLLVDGVVVDLNPSPPFDTFEWKFSQSAESGSHTIQVEIEDELGLMGATLLTPVTVEVIEPSLLDRISLARIGLFAALAVSAAALVLLCGWLLRRLWRSSAVSLLKSRLASPPAPPHHDIPVETRIYAVLLPLNQVYDPENPNGIPIWSKRLILGTDPAGSDLVLPGAHPRHCQAELTLHNGLFRLRSLDDTHSIWVNYQKVSRKDVELKQGDLIHFGKSGFRFTIGEDPTARKATVTRYEPIL